MRRLAARALFEVCRNREPIEPVKQKVISCVFALSVLSAGSLAASTEYSNGLLYVHAVSSGHDLLLLVDTGANKSALDATTAEVLKLKIRGEEEVEGTAGVMAVRGATLPELKLDGAKVANMPCTVQDLSGMLSVKGRKIDGILGSDFLKRFRVLFDYEKPEVAILSRPVH